MSVIQSLQSPRHDYFSFFVCRNPVAKLRSLYRYNKFRSLRAGGLREIPDFPAHRPPPSWQHFLELRVSAAANWTDGRRLPRGIEAPLWRLCDLCHNHWDAVIHMETFHSDSRAILKASGLGHISLAHMNNHGTKGAKGVSKAMVRALFRNASREVIEYVLSVYRNDFLLCGYTETLNELKKIKRNL